MPEHIPTKAEVLRRIHKNVRRSYPTEPERALQATAGAALVFDEGWSVDPRDTARVAGVVRWVLRLQAPTTTRPDPAIAKALKSQNFQRVTNHTWVYLLTEMPE